MPIVSNQVFDRDGYIYNISAVLTPNLRLNETAYKEYGKHSLSRCVAIDVCFFVCKAKFV